MSVIAPVGDVNGDWIDDMLWRNDDGHIREVFNTPDGYVAAAFDTVVTTDWMLM